MFHFNKAHLQDPTIPMWVVKTGGRTYYVEHVEANIPWTTKETPDNPHTKGSLKFRDCLLTIDADNTATLTTLTEQDRERLSTPETTRVIVLTDWGDEFRAALERMRIRHTAIKQVGGACSDCFYITDVFRRDYTALALALADSDLRELMPNEYYWRVYERNRDSTDEWIEDWPEDSDEFEPEYLSSTV